ncbi:MAG TPA: hypothetical protein IAA98_07900 [Candidatus Avipropionibacterium avicola]|uniref:Uncharacterized protein n=1 Tax=Candidatus Avipropionibacterium avicola TaxID=2840701 RepID=A0A9D1GY11_9ACTN|nr:hypothetical protein [Candidatus Avipropionibacterium avicola]
MSRFLAPADLDSTVLTSISRRLMLGSTCILGLAGCSRGRPDDDPVEAPTTRQVTTPLGTYDIPIRPPGSPPSTPASTWSRPSPCSSR